MYRRGLLLPLVLLTWAAAQGQTPQKKIPPAAQLLIRVGSEQFIKRFDTDGDGKLSRQEVPPFLAKIFDRLDKNEDGKLDRNEIDQLRRILLARLGNEDKAAPGKMASGKKARPMQNSTDFDALDRNADGRLSRDELKGTPFASHFDEIDTNHDGQIDRHEFEAYLLKKGSGVRVTSDK